MGGLEIPKTMKGYHTGSGKCSKKGVSYELA